MNALLLLAHEGHQHGPDLGLVALLVAGAVLAVLLLVGMLRSTTKGRSITKGADRRPSGPPPGD